MTIWLFTALSTSAGWSVVAGIFLAGSLQRPRMIWAAALAGMGIVVSALVLVSSLDPSFDSAWSLFGFNPPRLAKQVWKTSDYAPVIWGVLAGSAIPLVGLGFSLVATRQARRRQIPILAAFMGLALAGLFASTVVVPPSAVVPLRDASPELKVPPGFSIRAYLPQGLFFPTSIAFDSNDRLFVATVNGDVHVVEDTDGDGVGDEIRLYVHKDELALGLAISDDDRSVYISGGGQVLRVDDIDGDGRADSTSQIIEGLPSFIYDSHSNNGLAIGPDGRLYITLGGTADHGSEDYPLAGSILVANPDGTGLEVYASGLRNPYDVAFTSTGLLVASDNGPDRTDEQLTWTPPDELNLIREGADYGYPDYFGFPPAWSDSVGPIVAFRSHSVPTGLVAYPGGQFPSGYFDKVFVTLYGRGFSKVMTVAIGEVRPGVFRGDIEDFAFGFSSPIDVAVDSQARLYVADYGGNQVYQVSWTGDE